MSNQGTIVQIIGAVIDADFSKATKLPEIYNALNIQYVLNGVDTKLVLEVQQHLGDGWVRAVAMSTTDGLKRGMTLTDLGKPISIPVGKQVLGRIFNVTGDLVDENVPLADVTMQQKDMLLALDQGRKLKLDKVIIAMPSASGSATASATRATPKPRKPSKARLRP